MPIRDKKIISVSELLQIDNLTIPSYQRPYKWTEKNLNDLLSDLKRSRNKSSYRLGTLVFHDTENNTRDIVDGQQRTLTLMLLVKAIIDTRCEGLSRERLKSQLDPLNSKIKNFFSNSQFNSDISYYNLKQNYKVAERVVSRPEFTEEDISFLLNSCKLVMFVLTDISEAFQFFDSQNARGRDLDPHDLLKAFHLREFAKGEEKLKAQAVAHWESLDSANLVNVFANYLFRIRNWAQGNSAQYFQKSNVGLFKGVNINSVENYPYVKPFLIMHYFVDDYNKQYQRQVDHKIMDFPFQLDQTILNGRRFFEMIEHYQHLIGDIINDEHLYADEKLVVIQGETLDGLASEVIGTLNSYPSRTRVGDRYIRTLFDCALIFYIDKFGVMHLSEVVQKLFVWAYSCRLKMQVVQMATMDNYALNNNIFERIKLATQASEILNWPLKPLTESDNNKINGRKLEEVINLFKKLKYL